MPQSKITVKEVLSPGQIDILCDHYKRAEKFGLAGEWMQWFVSGLQQGMSPIEAAWEASFEWDL